MIEDSIKKVMKENSQVLHRLALSEFYKKAEEYMSENIIKCIADGSIEAKEDGSFHGYANAYWDGFEHALDM